MKNKFLIAILSLALILLIACQQAKEVQQPPVQEPKVETTGEAVVDAVGNDLNTVNSVEKDLGTDELGDIDSGLADVENI